MRDGQHWWEMPTSTVAVQADRQQEDAWSELVLPWAYLRVLEGHEFITVQEVLSGPLKMEPGRMDRAAQMRVARSLRVASWIKRNARINEKVVKGWYPPVATGGCNWTRWASTKKHRLHCYVAT